MRAMKKNAPVAPRERKKQRSERGLTPTGLIGGGNKQLIAKSHSKKNDQRTLDKARFKIYPITRTQSTDRKDIHKIDTFIAHHPRSKQRPRRHGTDTTGNNTPDAQAPPATRHEQTGAGKRGERGSEMSGTRSEPQPTEASTSRQTHGRSPRMRRHRHGHDDITEQASRENGLIIPPPSHDTTGGEQGGASAGNRNGGGSEKVISARVVLISSSQTTEDNRGGDGMTAWHGMTATEPKPTPLHQGNEAEPH